MENQTTSSKPSKFIGDEEEGLAIIDCLQRAEDGDVMQIEYETDETEDTSEEETPAEEEE